MDINTLIKSLENKLVTLEVKKKTSIEKGNFELLSTFDNEYIETATTLNLVKKAVEEIEVYRTKDVKEKLKLYLLENLPNLAFYFRQESINKVISDAFNNAFDKLIKEEFEDKVVQLVGDKI